MFFKMSRWKFKMFSYFKIQIFQMHIYLSQNGIFVTLRGKNPQILASNQNVFYSVNILSLQKC